MRRSLLSTAVVGTLLLAAACGAEEPDGDPEGTERSAAGTQDEAAQDEAAPDEETQQDPSPRAADDAGVEPVSEASWDPTSIHVLVNKANPLEPADHVPPDLTVPDVPMEQAAEMRAEPTAALEELFAAASEAEVPLVVTSAYRDFELQTALYEHYSDTMGQEAADEVSARPGHSEHQTGLAVDLSYPGNEECYLKACFGDTPTGVWLADNAHEHGFIIRYPEESQEITGFSYEPWHLRYVGQETAVDVVGQGVTLEEYWDQPAAPDYED